MKLTFRPLKREDIPLFAEWLGRPHVQKWWREPATIEYVEKEYGADVDGEATNAVFITEADGTAIGLIQCYRVGDYPEHAQSTQMADAIGVDLLIGEINYVGKGYGTTIIKRFVTEIIAKKYPNADTVVADPSADNLASIRAFEKAGFSKGPVVPQEHGPEQLMILRLP